MPFGRARQFREDQVAGLLAAGLGDRRFVAREERRDDLGHFLAIGSFARQLAQPQLGDQRQGRDVRDLIELLAIDRGELLGDLAAACERGDRLSRRLSRLPPG